MAVIKKTIHTDLNSDNMKRILMNYFRFEKGMFTASEVGVYGGVADIIAITKGKQKSIEVEIKTNIPDLKADFVQKRMKHKSMENCNDQMFGSYKPNYFYFCVPIGWLEETIEILKDKNKRYGIITIDSYENIEIAKEALEITYRNNERLYHNLLMRMSSELVRMYNKYVK